MRNLVSNGTTDLLAYLETPNTEAIDEVSSRPKIKAMDAVELQDIISVAASFLLQVYYVGPGFGNPLLSPTWWDINLERMEHIVFFAGMVLERTTLVSDRREMAMALTEVRKQCVATRACRRNTA